MYLQVQHRPPDPNGPAVRHPDDTPTTPRQALMRGASAIARARVPLRLPNKVYLDQSRPDAQIKPGGASGPPGVGTQSRSHTPHHPQHARTHARSKQQQTEPRRGSDPAMTSRGKGRRPAIRPDAKAYAARQTHSTQNARAHRAHHTCARERATRTWKQVEGRGSRTF